MIGAVEQRAMEIAIERGEPAAVIVRQSRAVRRARDIVVDQVDQPMPPAQRPTHQCRRVAADQQHRIAALETVRAQRANRRAAPPARDAVGARVAKIQIGGRQAAHGRPASKAARPAAT